LEGGGGGGGVEGPIFSLLTQMAGGLLNLTSQGSLNIKTCGNPKKTFYKYTCAKYTNFGLQKFRIDYQGTTTLQLTDPATFQFRVPRYADLLMDTYISINLPNIWSPIYPPNPNEPDGGKWIPYEFKWIENLGAKIIQKISITCGNYTIQEYSGNYLLAMVQRDFDTTKKNLFDKMIGNLAELNDPANAFGRINNYPNAYYNPDLGGVEPSIRGRILYIPLNNWFSLKSQMAFPLTSLQYNELHINITFRPIQEWFVVRDVFDSVNNYPYISPNFNQYYLQMHRFLQAPPDVSLGITSYTDTRTIWNADIHLNSTYCFLSNKEKLWFTETNQEYLIKQVYEYPFYNITGTHRVDLPSLGMVSSYMFYFQRSDANLRNQWSNYTNWPYNYLPSNVQPAPYKGLYPVIEPSGTLLIGPGLNPDGQPTGLEISGPYNPENEPTILINVGLLLDGEYRETIQPSGVYNYIEKYIRTNGNAPDGLYCYNFCLDTNPFVLQPSGGINMSRFNQIQLEFNTIIPPANPLAQNMVICNPETHQPIGVNKSNYQIYQYDYNLYVFEERINWVLLTGGNAGLEYQG
jgi:hypothetical protein